MAANHYQARKETFVWSDDEVELLLRVTLEYKKIKLRTKVDFETCHTKYGDIMDLFREHYPSPAPSNKEFPHNVKSISKGQVAAKVKSIRGKYKRAVDTGRRAGQGRVVLLFYDLCGEIWSETTAARSTDSGVEASREPGEASPRQSSSPEHFSDWAHPIESPDTPPPVAVKEPKLNGLRVDRQKRKLSSDPAVLEDIRIKRRMLELMEESSKRNADNLQQLTTNIVNISNTIQDGFNLLRTLMAEPQVSTPHTVKKDES